MLNLEIEARRGNPAAAAQAAQALPAQRTPEWLKSQARFGVPVWAVCLNCDYRRLLDSAELMAMVKPEVAELSALVQRMRCRGCGGKACELRAAAPIPEYCS